MSQKQNISNVTSLLPINLRCGCSKVAAAQLAAAKAKVFSKINF